MLRVSRLLQASTTHLQVWLDPAGGIHKVEGQSHHAWAASHLNMEDEEQAHDELIDANWIRIGKMGFGKYLSTYAESGNWSQKTLTRVQHFLMTNQEFYSDTMYVENGDTCIDLNMSEFLSFNKVSDLLRSHVAGYYDPSGNAHGELLSKTNKDPKVIIFRAVPKGTETINTKDYVTLSRRFAEEHAATSAVYEEDPFVVLKSYVATNLVAEAYNPGEYFYIGPPIPGKIVSIANDDGHLRKVADVAPYQIPMDEAIKEHTRLVKVLKSPSHKDDLIEAEEQAEELAGMYKKAGGYVLTPPKKSKNPLYIRGWILPDGSFEEITHEHGVDAYYRLGEGNEHSLMKQGWIRVYASLEYHEIGAEAHGWASQKFRNFQMFLMRNSSKFEGCQVWIEGGAIKNAHSFEDILAANSITDLRGLRYAGNSLRNPRSLRATQAH